MYRVNDPLYTSILERARLGKTTKEDNQELCKRLFAYKKYIKEIYEKGIKVKIIGERDKFTKSLRDKIRQVEEMTENNKNMILNFTLSYGGRAEIVVASGNFHGRTTTIVGFSSDADYRADRGAFFKSMHGTLNHLLTADWAWMHRFTGEGPSPTRLDAIHHDTLPGLRAAREAEDRRIIAYIDSLTEQKLAGTISYRRVSTPEAFVQPLAPALAHFFNHQAHHRG